MRKGRRLTLFGFDIQSMHDGAWGGPSAFFMHTRQFLAFGSPTFLGVVGSVAKHVTSAAIGSLLLFAQGLLCPLIFYYLLGVVADGLSTRHGISITRTPQHAASAGISTGQWHHARVRDCN